MLEIIIIATCIMAEAEGEGVRGRELVADTIWNRPGTAIEVVTAPGQFCGIALAGNRAELDRRIKRSPAEWAHCLQLAVRLHRGSYEPTTNFTHFFAWRQVTPAWASAFVESETYRNHRFGRM